MQIIYPSPGILAGTTGDEAARFLIHGDTRDFVREIDLLQQEARFRAIEEVDGSAGGDAQNARVIGHCGQRVELAAADRALDVVLDHGVPRSQIPPSDLAVFGGGGEDVVVLVPNDGFDGALVDAGADFVARCRPGARISVVVIVRMIIVGVSIVGGGLC